jgi:hypothetical protein
MSTPLTLALIALTAVLAAGGGYLFVRWRRPKPEEPVCHFACPHCKRRLGYRAAQSGHRGQCPRCRQALTFPVTPRG